MLWYKSWLETRWRFLIGAVLLLCSAATTVLIYPQIVSLMPHLPANVGGELGARIRESAELASTFRGYVWGEWFRQNSTRWLTLFAVLLGTAGVLSSSRLFTLSLPFSRKQILGVRAAAGLGELFLLAFLPSMLIPMLAPAIGEQFSIGAALIHGICLFIGVSVFYALALLLSTVFLDPWRPLLLALAAAFAIAFVGRVLDFSVIDVFRVMSAEAYFRRGEVPWAGLLASGAVAAALYGGAVANVARRDF